MKKLDRRTFMKIFALAVGIVASPCGLKTLALSGSDIDNLQLADGAYAEQLAFEIAKEFENSPEVFLQQISGLRTVILNGFRTICFMHIPTEI